jgi:hypothetical protein
MENNTNKNNKIKVEKQVAIFLEKLSHYDDNFVANATPVVPLQVQNDDIFNDEMHDMQDLPINNLHDVQDLSTNDVHDVQDIPANSLNVVDPSIDADPDTDILPGVGDGFEDSSIFENDETLEELARIEDTINAQLRSFDDRPADEPTASTASETKAKTSFFKSLKNLFKGKRHNKAELAIDDTAT